MPGDPPVEEDQATVAVGGEPVAPTHRTPDDSTLLLPTPADSADGFDSPVEAQRTATVRFVAGESLAGRFTILRFIARGGMGEVYEADDRILKTRVALKVIGGRIATDATELERFRREVLLSRRIGHPNVCRVYEFYEAKTAAAVPIHFLTMEFLEGETLARLIERKGHLTPAEMLPLVRQMCEGLAAAHAEGVIHRDFKSSNVILVPRAMTPGDPTTGTTRVVITDFGLARALEVERGTERLSGGAGILGTPDYMAPEQVTGGEVKPATDIYALGVVVYEMATGKLPFADKTPLASAARRLNEDPPRPEVAAPGLESRWASTITRCMARQPDRRFQSAHEVIAALDLQRRPRRLWVVACLGAVGLLVASFVLVRYGHSFWPRRPRVAVQTVSRPVVGILGFRNELASPQLNWLPTAVSELIAHELASAETSLRVIPTDRVARVRRSLGVSEDAIADQRTLARMQGLLAANVLVYGSLMPKLSDPNDVRLRLDVVDGQTTRPRATLEEDLGPNGARLTEAVIDVAARIREVLGVSLSPEEEVLSSLRVHSLDTARVYAQGVMSFRNFDYEGARGFFDAARGGEPDFLDAHLRTINLWEAQENGKKLRQAIAYLRERKLGLTPGLTAVLNEKFLVNAPEYNGDENVATAVFDAAPDDVELGLNLALNQLGPRTTLAIIQRLRRLPAPVSTDLRFDIAEGSNVGKLGETNRAQELFTRATARAKELGAKAELAWILQDQSLLLYASEGRGASWLAPALEAERLFAEVGELDEVAQVKVWKAYVLSFADAPGALAANEEAAALFTKLGDRVMLQQIDLQSAFALAAQLEFDRAREKIDDARVELEALGVPLSGDYFGALATVAFEEADIAGYKAAAQGMRAASAEIPALIAEAQLLREEDRLSEARESFLSAAKLLEEQGQRSISIARKLEACPIYCDNGEVAKGLACLAELWATAPMEGNVKCSTLLSEGKCKYAADDLVGAGRAAREALSIAEHTNYTSCQMQSSMLIMRVDAAQGRGVSKAISTLRARLAYLESKHARKLAFVTALGLGEIELRAGRPEGRPRLLQLEQEAKSRRFFRLARTAREVLEKKNASHTRARL